MTRICTPRNRGSVDLGSIKAGTNPRLVVTDSRHAALPGLAYTQRAGTNTTVVWPGASVTRRAGPPARSVTVFVTGQWSLTRK